MREARGVVGGGQNFKYMGPDRDGLNLFCFDEGWVRTLDTEHNILNLFLWYEPKWTLAYQNLILALNVLA